MLKLSLLATLAATALTLAFAGTANAKVRSCNSAAGPTVRITSARDMSCRSAQKDMARYRGSISRKFKTPGGFQCKRATGQSLQGTWRCTKGHKAYRFAFAD